MWSKLLSRQMARANWSMERFEGLQRNRFSSAQLTLEVMFTTARHKPWKGPVGLVLSAERNTAVEAEMWRRFTPALDVRVIDVKHRNLFGASARATGDAVAEIVDDAEAQGRVLHRQ